MKPDFREVMKQMARGKDPVTAIRAAEAAAESSIAVGEQVQVVRGNQLLELATGLLARVLAIRPGHGGVEITLSLLTGRQAGRHISMYCRALAPSTRMALVFADPTFYPKSAIQIAVR